ncbi:MAG: SpoIIE family protein phosphatase [Clostridia bacterium]|nr:SpoIIE family protein phosphatase [Clostridia bacterium]
MTLSITVANIINALIISIGIGVCGLNMLQIGFAARLTKNTTRYFQLFFGFIITYISTHLIRMLFEGISGGGITVLLKISAFIEFISSGCMVFLISLLVLHLTSPEKKLAFFIAFFSLLVLYAATLVAAQFSEFYYYFDENNVYFRGSAYLSSNAFHLILMIADMYLLLRYRNKIQKRIRYAIWTCILAPLVAMIAQAAVKDIQFIIIATIFGAMNMYIAIMWDIVEKHETQKKENARIETELTMASAIQADMLPNIFPAFPDRPDFEIYASMDPAKEIGGDFYDFYLVDDNTLAITIADVSGKGIPAALFMMVSKILVQNYTMMGLSPEKVLEAVNRQICMNNHEDMFVTVWLGIIDLKSGTMSAVNAGHEYPTLKSPDGGFDELKDKHGFVIGGMPGAKYKKYDVLLQKGSKIFVYTDGVVEAKNEKGELFGKERLAAVLEKSKNCSPEKIIGEVKKEIKEFAGKAPPFDDITMLCLQYNGSDMEIRELTVTATLENVEKVTDFVNEELEKYDCPPKAQMQIDVAIDELFGNIAHYAYDPDVGPATVRVEVEEDPLAVVITFIDKGKPFDPLAQSAPDLNSSAEERAVGGLGVFLVRKTMDEITYEYKNGQNILKIKKHM